MPRPTKPRWVEFMPDVTYFKPAGVPLARLEEVTLGIDEAEAIRLKDHVGLEQEECAARMNLAQSTFQRILTEARIKVAKALVEGKALRIVGGNYLISPLAFECQDCSHEWTNSGDVPKERLCPNCGSTHLEPFRKVPVGPEHAMQRLRGRRQGRHGRGNRRQD